MGIPKFFRWAAERYPQVITPFKDTPPPIDNLYLDMNGIIHRCTHPDDIDAHKRSPTEKEMVSAIFSYIEKLFAAIQPRKHFLMAVDGVAPRAKMNQQRQRRYRAGYEMMVAREEALALGEEIPDEGDVFDSNCITPGTEFMFRISEHLQYFVTMKIHNDALWRNCTVIYSGHDNPGEGEHKIMDFIRRRKMQPDYPANETHCMYGLDADLMMLSMATHEPHFVLLREVVSFGGSKREQEKKAEEEARGLVESKTLAKVDSFVLFHIGLLREYLEIDLTRPDVPKFDMERVIDDFVFMCFFIGNDFLPSIPTLAIADGSMDQLMEIYREVALKKGTHLTRDGKVNWNTVEMMLSRIGEKELEALRARQEEEHEYRKRQRGRGREHEVDFTPTVPITNMADYKQKYYSEKHRFEEGWNPRGQEISDLRQHYVEGLMWVMEYYYRGPPSWKWFYPHHYAPLASDLVNLSNYAGKVRFDKGTPFLPHQQLLAVLPPMSARSLPSPYWPLLQSNNSPLKKFFPDHLEIDKEGARNPWEGIVLVPFIDEAELLAAYETVQSELNEADKAKNRNTNNFLFRHSPSVQPYMVPSSMFEPLQNVQVERKSYKFPEAPAFVPRLMPGVRIGDAGGMEGFASFHSKLHLLQPVYEIGAVNIFGFPTKKESLLLKFGSVDGLTPNVTRTSLPSADDFRYLLGQRTWIAFPYYKRGRVAAMTDSKGILSAVYDKVGNFASVDRREHTNDTLLAFKRDVEAHQGALKSKCGLILPEIPILVHVHRQIDMRVSRAGRLVPQYSKKETVYPLQLISPVDKANLQEDARFIERDRSDSDYNVGTSVLYIGPPPKGVRSEEENPCYGCTGYVMEQLDGDSFDITLTLRAETRPRLPAVIDQYSSKNFWHPISEVAEMLHLPSAVVSQICSSVITTPQYGSQELGLQLKFTGKELARIGFAKLVQTHFNPWYVSRPNLFGFMADDEDDEVIGYHLQKEGGGPGPNDRKFGGRNGRDEGRKRGQYSGGTSVNAAGKGTWFFSDKAVALLREYCDTFRPLVARLEEGGGNTYALEPQSFLTGEWQDSDPVAILKRIEKWLEEKGIAKLPMANAGDDCLEDSLIQTLEQFLDTLTLPPPTKQLRLRKVQARSLYFPTVRMPEGFVTAVPLPLKDQRFMVGSRIVHCRTSGTVPFGSLGTVTRLLAHGQTAEVVLDEPIVGGSTFGGRLKKPRGALIKLQAMLLLDREMRSSSALSPEISAMPTPSPSSMPAPELEGVVMPASLTSSGFKGAPRDTGAEFNLGSWAIKMGLGGEAKRLDGKAPAATAVPTSAPATAPVPEVATKPTAPLIIPTPKSKRGDADGGVNVAEVLRRAPSAEALKAAEVKPSAGAPGSSAEGVNIAERLAMARTAQPSPPPSDTPLARSSSGGVNVADLAKKISAANGERPVRVTPPSIPTPTQPFSGDLRTLQAQLSTTAISTPAAGRLEPIGETVSPHKSTPTPAETPSLVPKPRSRTEGPMSPTAVDGEPNRPPATPQSPAPASSAQSALSTPIPNLKPGRLTEDKIAFMMNEMVKAQLKARYGD